MLFTCYVLPFKAHSSAEDKGVWMEKWYPLNQVSEVKMTQIHQIWVRIKIMHPPTAFKTQNSTEVNTNKTFIQVSLVTSELIFKIYFLK